MFWWQNWNFVDLQEWFTYIGCKLVLRIKTIKHGIVFTHKARLVAKGYKKIHGMDCVETSCIIVMLKSIKRIPQSNIGINYVHGMSEDLWIQINAWKGKLAYEI